ncbi:hypothetical protein ACHAXT_009983 [Thalassiosira profunda]
MACSVSPTLFARGRCMHRATTALHPTRAFAATCVSANDPHPEPRCTNTQHAPEGFDPASAAVYPNFLTEAEGKSLIKEASKRLKRRRFENGHWDSVITGYREVELSQDCSSPADQNDVPLFAKVIERTRSHIATHHLTNNKLLWNPCHAIDLSADGELTAHVDSVKFSGEIVAGVSLLSDSIMRLRPSSKEWESDGNSQNIDDDTDKPEGYVNLYLPQLSLYVLSGMSRYTYTHELLPSGSSFQFSDGDSIEVTRGRRLSVIFRDAHESS